MITHLRDISNWMVCLYSFHCSKHDWISSDEMLMLYGALVAICFETTMGSLVMGFHSDLPP